MVLFQLVLSCTGEGGGLKFSLFTISSYFGGGSQYVSKRTHQKPSKKRSNLTCVRRRRARKHPLTVVVPPIFIFRCERRIYVDFCEGELLRRNTGDPFCTKWRLFVIGRDCHICNSPVSSLSFSYVFRIFCNSAQKEMTNITINAARSTNSTSMLGVLIGFFVFVEIIV